MNWKALLTHLFREDTPNSDEEQLPDTHSHDVGDPEKVGHYADVVPNGGGTVDKENLDSEHDDDLDIDVDLDNQPESNLSGPRRCLSKVWSSVFPSRSKEEEIQAYIPHYRHLPILSGIAVPFCILLEIPGLTAEWYTRTSHYTVVASKPNPPLLDVGIALSLLCAILANLCLIVRFLERRVKAMTILCILFLSIHDSVNVAALAAFGATRDGYSYGQAFWMTLCSTIISLFTNVTLIIDLVRHPDLNRSGSGLTRRQRSLVIIIIGLFCYIALGALVNALLLDLSFINGLYFTVVTIETIGFGDIVPNTRSSRVFIGFYATIGIINLAFVVGYVRETVLEGLDFGYRRRLSAIQERRRVARRRKRAQNRWRHAIIWRLRRRHERVWIPDDEHDRGSLWSKLSSLYWRLRWKIRSSLTRNTHQSHARRGMKLNLWALPRCQLESAALEAGVPLETLLPEDFYETYEQETCDHGEGVEHHPLPSWFAIHPVYRSGERPAEPPTHRRVGAMAAMITKLGLAIYESGGNSLPNGHGIQDAEGEAVAQDSSGSLQSSSSDDRDYRADVADTEQRAYFTRSGLSWGWFLIFWMGGAAIFRATEGWSYGTAIYFCFISFSTIGYGDLTPTTPVGRAIFVIWALVGVATITIFVSVVSEAYSSRYKGILGRNSFKHVIQQYRKRTKVELSEQVQRIGTTTNFGRQDTLEHEETNLVRYRSPLPMDDTVEDNLPVASTSKSEQQSLERLPRQILSETRSIEQYLRLMNDFDGHSADLERSVDESIWGLIDEVMGGRKLNECTKMDLLKDGEARQTLITLGIERSLRELVNISEQAITAIQERDHMIARLEQEREQDEVTVS